MIAIWLRVLLLWFCVAGAAAQTPLDDVARHVGSGVCADCHAAQTNLWRTSHHARSMQEATSASVLGDFNDVAFTENGAATRFFRRGDAFIIETRGPAGEAREDRVRFTFGVTPLQQYLVEAPGGRLQAFSVAWDARPKEKGGQRWFGLYPEETIAWGDPLHWSGRNQNWNFMCADCHSTGLRKNYDLTTDSYRTTWTDVSVACEACHGPGSAHVAWARGGARAGADKGFAASASDDRSELCFPCHSRRRALSETPAPTRRFLDDYAPALLDKGLFRADGQIEDEVFEYASFLQSRMYRAGVACIDCHEPHGGALREQGNALCARCHEPAGFDASSHHHHAPGTREAQCVACHMPSRIYMQVHERHDHGFRVPRPDLAPLGVPNACNDCHADKPASWAAEAMRGWGSRRLGQASAAKAIALGRRAAPGAAEALAALAGDGGESAIMRATALSLLARAPGEMALRAIREAIGSSDALLRLGAIRALEPYDATTRRLAAPLLADPAAATRLEAARLLAATGVSAEEWVAAELVSAERPETHLGVGALRAEQGRPLEAIAAFETALRLDPKFTPARLDLADLLRSEGRDAEAEAPLREAVRRDPADAVAHYALALWLLRQSREMEARSELARAVTLAPDDPAIARAYRLATPPR
ncbi:MULTISPECIES: multiheme c-type cytochrome [Methylosinus]|uniref:Cytochrome C family protein n=1 Tax=Methylosinus trichosporium (strain ATCC 35070 / NCIMB 11131 / UNIQEM 75 / OB3b) TaxID=595536 RepID=A0A2D2D6N3_METT3|nr:MULTISPECIES: multiheme c-type cytochrome [Methylosinus]ATQ70666.1 cytochrome C family protein [Methylosinus trichosporium OB3b]